MVATHPTIRDLIELRIEQTGWSYQSMSDASGGVVGRQTIYELVANPVKSWPKNVSTITGLAQALNMTEEVVVLAYAASLGIPLRKQPSLLALQLPPSADLLTSTERAHIIGLIQSIVADRTDDLPPDGDSVDDAEDRTNARVRGAARDAAARARRPHGQRKSS